MLPNSDILYALNMYKTKLFYIFLFSYFQIVLFLFFESHTQRRCSRKLRVMTARKQGFQLRRVSIFSQNPLHVTRRHERKVFHIELKYFVVIYCIIWPLSPPSPPLVVETLQTAYAMAWDTHPRRTAFRLLRASCVHSGAVSAAKSSLRGAWGFRLRGREYDRSGFADTASRSRSCGVREVLHLSTSAHQRCDSSVRERWRLDPYFWFFWNETFVLPYAFSFDIYFKIVYR